MNPNDNRRFHLLLKELGLGDEAKAQLVYAFSDGRASSSTELTPAEVSGLLRYLQDEHGKACKPMRGKIIHFLTLLGYVTGDDTPDYERINRFIVDIGRNNPRRVILNYLYRSELPAVVSQVQAMYKHELGRLAKAK